MMRQHPPPGMRRSGGGYDGVVSSSLSWGWGSWKLSFVWLLLLSPSSWRRGAATTATAMSISRLLQEMDASTLSTPMNLQGRHFRITVVRESTFLNIRHDDTTGELQFEGYIIDMIASLSLLASFTYDLVPPSGLGPDCQPQLSLNTAASDNNQLYSSTYFNQYNCGANDVTDLPYMTTTNTTTGTNQNASLSYADYVTDMYAGMFYISPQRQLKNRFTMPFSPPEQGTQVMYGTAVRLPNISALVTAQLAGEQPPVCVYGSSAVVQVLQAAFPLLQIHEFFGTEHDVYLSMYDGSCPIHIWDYPIATQFVLQQYQQQQCTDAVGNPIGVIGDPMTFGLTHYSLGVGYHVQPITVTDTLSYYINVLMNCNSNQTNDGAATTTATTARNDECPNGNLYSMYQGNGGGTGLECGYILYPPVPAVPSSDDPQLSVPLITGVLGGSVLLLVASLIWYHVYQIRQQAQRYKYRFVEQIARNIEIGPSPGLIPPEKLAEEIQHIANGKPYITKPDMMQWMNDLKLTFLSQNDLNALWDAMDFHRTGQVDPVEFIVFLSACGPQFEQVYQQHKSLPKTEKLKLAARRLTNLATLGEEGVRKLERKLDRGTKDQPGIATTAAAKVAAASSQPPPLSSPQPPSVRKVVTTVVGQAFRRGGNGGPATTTTTPTPHPNPTAAAAAAVAASSGSAMDRCCAGWQFSSCGGGGSSHNRHKSYFHPSDRRNSTSTCYPRSRRAGRGLTVGKLQRSWSSKSQPPWGRMGRPPSCGSGSGSNNNNNREDQAPSPAYDYNYYYSNPDDYHGHHNHHYSTNNANQRRRLRRNREFSCSSTVPSGFLSESLRAPGVAVAAALQDGMDDDDHDQNHHHYHPTKGNDDDDKEEEKQEETSAIVVPSPPPPLSGVERTDIDPDAEASGCSSSVPSSPTTRVVVIPSSLFHGAHATGGGPPLSPLASPQSRRVVPTTTTTVSYDDGDDDNEEYHDSCHPVVVTTEPDTEDTGQKKGEEDHDNNHENENLEGGATTELQPRSVRQNNPQGSDEEPPVPSLQLPTPPLHDPAD